jgi:kynurenine 3-monooxygenase
MVTFRPDIGYSEALRRERWQKRIVEWAGWGSVGVGITIAVVASTRLWKNSGLYRT